jgi:methyl-accepting chemotaxis protein
VLNPVKYGVQHLFLGGDHMNKRKLVLQILSIGTIDTLLFLGVLFWMNQVNSQNIVVIAALSYLVPAVVLILWNRSSVQLQSEMIQVLKRFNDGDFTASIRNNIKEKEAVEIKGQFEKLRNMMNSWIYELLYSAVAVKTSVEKINEDSEKTTQGMQYLNQSLTEISLSFGKTSEMLSDVSDAAQQLSQSGNGIADGSADTVDCVRKANGAAQEGGAALEEATTSIETIQRQVTDASAQLTRLEQSSKQIENINDLITTISHQTNLLALNASIEAARAGEQGKGFGVVAEEVRKLSEETKLAANKINELIVVIQKEVQGAVGIMENTNKEVEKGVFVISGANINLNEIIETTGSALSSMEHISVAARNQSQKTEVISDNAKEVSSQSQTGTASVEEITSVMEDQAENMHKTNQTTQELLGISHNLEKIMDRFDKTLGEQMIKVCSQIAETIALHKREKKEEFTNHQLTELTQKYGVSEIHIIDEHGIVTKSNNSGLLGFQFSDREGTQTYEFLKILKNPSLIVNQKAAFRDVDEKLFKYTGVSMIGQTGIVQCGLDASKLTEFSGDLRSN